MNIKLDIPESFFQGEERCGYYVEPLMKKVWATELDLIAAFDRICRKYNLKWYADGGTLLGAVRHKGFIPWDDDVDILMMRKDYDTFCEVAPEELNYPYEFQSAEEGGFVSFPPIIRLLNLPTTMFNWWTLPAVRTNLKLGRSLSFTHKQCIFIDISPMDNVPDDENDLMKLYKKLMRSFYRTQKLSGLTDYYYPANSRLKRPAKYLLHKILKGLNITSSRYFYDYLDLIKSYNGVDTKRISILTHSYTENFLSGNKIWDRSLFDDIIYMPFEMLKIPVAVGYEKMLSQYYGEWEQFVIIKPHGQIYDPDHPYTYYTEEGHPF